jgi:hypothetical protein
MELQNTQTVQFLKKCDTPDPAFLKLNSDSISQPGT